MIRIALAFAFLSVPAMSGQDELCQEISWGCKRKEEEEGKCLNAFFHWTSCEQAIKQAIRDYEGASTEEGRDQAYARYTRAYGKLEGLIKEVEKDLAEEGGSLPVQVRGLPAILRDMITKTKESLTKLETDMTASLAARGAMDASDSLSAELKPLEPKPDSGQRGRLTRETRLAEDKAVEKGEKDGEVFKDFGKKYLEAGRPQDAERALSRSLKLGPGDPEARALLAQSRWLQGSKEEALEDARRALALDPKNRIAQLILGHTDSLRQAERKARLGRLSLASSPADSEDPSIPLSARNLKPPVGPGETNASPASLRLSLIQRALAKMRIKDYAAALLELRQAIDQDPKNPSSWAILAELSNLMGNFEGALKAAEEALRLDPGNAQALRARAYAYLQMGNFRMALEDAQRAIELDPGNGLGYLYRAMAREKLGFSQEALKDYQEAARLDPTLKPLAEAALRRIQGVGPPAPAKTRLLLRGGLIVLSLGLVLCGLLGTAAGRSWTRSARRWLSAPSPTALRQTLAPGALLGGNFRIAGELGRGGMGIVYEGFDLALQRRVAIKQLQRDSASSREDLERFLREARLVARLKHPHLAAIYSVIEEGELYLVFEHLEGRALDAVLAQKGRLGLDETRAVLGEVCSAVDYAHAQKIIHRDLKPSNIMIASDGSCKVMDFGIAHQAQTLSKVTETLASGTPPYMAPEQALGAVSRASDLYSLGVMTYEMLTGRLPFEGPNFLEQKLTRDFRPATQANPGLPKPLDDFFRLALEPDPAGRPASARDFLKAFETARIPLKT